MPDSDAPMLPGLELPNAQTVSPLEQSAPEEIQEAMRFLSGGGLFTDEETSDPALPPKYASAQAKFLDKRAKRSTEYTVNDLEIGAFDIGLEQGRTDYAAFMTKVMPKALSKPDKYKLLEHPLQFIPTDEGVKILSVVRFWRQEALPGKDKNDYTVLSKENIPTRT